MQPKLLSFVGRSNSGKTTFITKILPLFCQRGLKVGSIKNTHHQVKFDKPGKDSYRHREAGSSQVLLLTEDRFAIFGERPEQHSLHQLAAKWFDDFDLVLSEGFKNEDSFKIEISREANQKKPLYTNPAYQIQALISDRTAEISIPHFDLNDVNGVFEWICGQLEL
ncbi:MAG: molybdopterin-guanine dinucleotide biosynthesis protein B [SAR324 cluster bacterium]|uniref:Molybdopterin-guanine dinucleotide biosynthesis protein B n=1 Tax=SAR324 cluster bacterium TaxID=2024889 RepID=A0A2A4T719_9DELT|nr:MAG: molybdopterin-guanine dinucleotide biosynthesis protein B [SAR324 cluster bacterium]